MEKSIGGYQPTHDLTTNPPGFDENDYSYPFELYLLILGERSIDYCYTPEDIVKHLDYFRECHKNNLSAYKALEWFNYELTEEKMEEIRSRPPKI